MTRERYRIQMYWPGRPDTLPQLAEQLGGFLDQLREAHGALDGFAPLDRRTAVLQEVPRPQQLRDLLSANAIPWRVGGADVVSYAPRFALRQARGAAAEFQLTVGIPALPIPDGVVSNRLAFYVRADDRMLADPAVLVAVLRAAVNSFAPRWGYVGTESTPTAPRPMFSPPGPVVGWITYFDASFALDEVRLPEIAVALPIAGRGVAIVSQREPFDPDRREHREAIQTVESLLRGAGVVG